ncbi:MAG: hypothetical protein QW794_09005 [Thermosphaera sp.]
MKMRTTPTDTILGPAAQEVEREEVNKLTFLERSEVLELEQLQTVDYVKELDLMLVEGVIDAATYNRLKRIVDIFRIDPKELIDWERRKMDERLEVLKKARVNLSLLRERWIRDREIDVEKVVANGRQPKPTPSYVAMCLADWAVETQLVKPVRVIWDRESVEEGVRAGRLIYGGDHLKSAAFALARAAEPEYTAQQLVTGVLIELKARAENIPRERVNPPHLLNTESGVIDLRDLTVCDGDYVFTYELPGVNLKLLEYLKRGEVGEEYFADKPFYKVIRKHYSDEEWEKLCDCLGALLLPETAKLVAIIEGPTDTRKTVLLSLMKEALGGLVAVVRLRQLQENRFALQHTLGARALVSSEEAQTIVRNIDIIKSVSGGDPLYVDRKFLPAVERERNPLKVYIFANGLPRFKEYDEALVGRLVIVQTENPQPPDDSEKEMIREALRDRRSFIEFLLYCYSRVRQKGYIKGQGSEEYISMILESESNVYTFARELKEGRVELDGYVIHAVFDKKAETVGTKAYEAYLLWCRERGEKAVGRNTFYDHFTSAAGVVRVTRNKTVVLRGVGIYVIDKAQATLPET